MHKPECVGRLSGSLDQGAAPLTDLKGIMLNFNSISGSIHFTHTGSIQSFTISGNHLSGTMPDLGNVPNLVSFLADNNRMSGTLQPLPSSIAFLLLFNNTHLSGSLPVSLQRTSLLSALDLSACALTGDFTNLNGSVMNEEMRFIHLNSNAISGTLSQLWLAGSPNVVSIILFDNQMSGALPELHFASSNRSVTATSRMRYVSTGISRISGSIPESICSLNNLKAFSSNSMQLSGILPSCVTNLSLVSTFASGMNYISGTCLSCNTPANNREC